jgi:hypothetical protein
MEFCLLPGAEVLTHALLFLHMKVCQAMPEYETYVLELGSFGVQRSSWIGLYWYYDFYK